LTVGKPEDRNPEEDGASSETTRDLINPSIVEVVPLGCACTENGWLDSLPHVAGVPVPPGLERVGGHSLTEGLEKQLEGRAHDVAARWAQDVKLLAEDQDWDGDNEHDGGNEVSQPETDITFCVNHTDLTDQSTNVDEEVEPILRYLLANEAA
jgi:hypothetical protein